MLPRPPETAGAAQTVGRGVMARIATGHVGSLRSSMSPKFDDVPMSPADDPGQQVLGQYNSRILMDAYLDAVGPSNVWVS